MSQLDLYLGWWPFILKKNNNKKTWYNSIFRNSHDEEEDAEEDEEEEYYDQSFNPGNESPASVSQRAILIGSPLPGNRCAYPISCDFKAVKCQFLMEFCDIILKGNHNPDN